MKQIKIAVVTIICALLLCACNQNQQAIGQVTAYENGILSIETYDGKNFDFQVDTLQTSIFGLADDEADPLGDGTDRRVQVTYSKKQGKFYAQTIFVDSRLYRNVLRLSDGTPVDIWQRNGWREYCLEDGTVLLVEEYIGQLENSNGWNALLNSGDFPENVQKGIQNYYSEMGQRYDIPALLENAYLVYGFSEEFNNAYVSQHSSIEDWNDRIICCKMQMILPQENSNGGTDCFYEGAVFDRQTGAHISNYDLFILTPEELEDYLLDELDEDGTLNRENIALNLKPEQIVLCKDGDIAFYLVDREENGVHEMLQIVLSSKQAKEILKPWALVGLENKS